MKRLSVLSLLLVSCVFLVKTQAYGGILGFGKADPENPFAGKILMDVFELNEGFEPYLPFSGSYHPPSKIDLYDSKVRRDFLAFNSSTSVDIGGINFNRYRMFDRSPFITGPQHYSYSVKDNTITINGESGKTHTLFFEKKGRIIYFKDGLMGPVYTFIDLPQPSILTDSNSELLKMSKQSDEDYEREQQIMEHYTPMPGSGNDTKFFDYHEYLQDQQRKYWANKMIDWTRNYIQSIEPTFSNTFSNCPQLKPVGPPVPFPKLQIPESSTFQFASNKYKYTITNYFKSNNIIGFSGFSYFYYNGETFPITGYFEDKITYDSCHSDASVKGFLTVQKTDGKTQYNLTGVFSLINSIGKINKSDVQLSDLKNVDKLYLFDPASNNGSDYSEIITNGSMTLINLFKSAHSKSIIDPNCASSNQISSNSSSLITNSESTHQFESNRPTSTEASKPIDTNATGSLPFNSDYRGNIVNSESGNKSSISLNISSTSQSYSPSHIPIHGKLVMSNGKTDDGFNGYFDSTSSPKSFSLGWDNSQGTMEMNGKVIDSSLIATWRIKTKPEGKIVSGTIDASKQ
jgi:hypothetical protein